MNEPMTANNIPDSIIDEIKSAISNKDYGSVEIYIESGRVVQITERTIRKTRALDNGAAAYNHNLSNNKSVQR